LSTVVNNYFEQINDDDDDDRQTDRLTDCPTETSDSVSVGQTDS